MYERSKLKEQKIKNLQVLKKIRQLELEQRECTFTPKISPLSKTLAKDHLARTSTDSRESILKILQK